MIIHVSLQSYLCVEQILHRKARNVIVVLIFLSKCVAVWSNTPCSVHCIHCTLLCTHTHTHWNTITERNYSLALNKPYGVIVSDMFGYEYPVAATRISTFDSLLLFISVCNVVWLCSEDGGGVGYWINFLSEGLVSVLEQEWIMPRTHNVSFPLCRAALSPFGNLKTNYHPLARVQIQL